MSFDAGRAGTYRDDPRGDVVTAALACFDAAERVATARLLRSLASKAAFAGTALGVLAVIMTGISSFAHLVSAVLIGAQLLVVLAVVLVARTRKAAKRVAARHMIVSDTSSAVHPSVARIREEVANATQRAAGSAAERTVALVFTIASVLSFVANHRLATLGAIGISMPAALLARRIARARAHDFRSTAAVAVALVALGAAAASLTPTTWLGTAPEAWLTLAALVVPPLWITSWIRRREATERAALETVLGNVVRLETNDLPEEHEPRIERPSAAEHGWAFELACLVAWACSAFLVVTVEHGLLLLPAAPALAAPFAFAALAFRQRGLERGTLLIGVGALMAFEFVFAGGDLGGFIGLGAFATLVYALLKLPGASRASDPAAPDGLAASRRHSPVASPAPDGAEAEA